MGAWNTTQVSVAFLSSLSCWFWEGLVLILAQIFTSGFVNKVFLEHSCIRLFPYCPWLVLYSQLQGGVIPTRTAGSAWWLKDSLSASCKVCVLQIWPECLSAGSSTGEWVTGGRMERSSVPEFLSSVVSFLRLVPSVIGSPTEATEVGPLHLESWSPKTVR